MEDKVFEIVSKVMGIPMSNVNIDSSPDTIVEWDSLKNINLMMALEEEFDVQFSPEEISDMLNMKLILLTLNQSIST
jgi:acyl carrier protein|tara:strand:- start:1191 stop:1421 length:231 start_codon:yes stop_codon:yes gene_type:complete